MIPARFALISVIIMGVVFTAGAQSPVARFTALNNQIRDGALSKTRARQLFIQQVADLLSFYRDTALTQTRQWCFPLKGYTATAIGGKNGSGYLSAGYDYFDGNKHGGHPAHDIFIQDANQDGLDDRTQQPVQVLAALDGVVLATATGWAAGSEQRGGNYIWILCPADSLLLYYAHNNTVLVTPGMFIKQGTTIASVGRSGYNAAKKRSPTHLHFMALKLTDHLLPLSINTYKMLVEAKNQ